MTTTNPGALLQERLQKIERARAATAAQQARAATTPAPAPTQQPARLAAAPAQDTPAPAPAATSPGGAAGSMTAQQRLIWDIVRAAQRGGTRDLTRREIWLRWCTQSGKPQSDGAVSGRVNELLKTRYWLLERDEERASADSEALSRPVYIPPHLLHASPQVRGRR